MNDGRGFLVIKLSFHFNYTVEHSLWKYRIQKERYEWERQVIEFSPLNNTSEKSKLDEIAYKKFSYFFFLISLVNLSFRSLFKLSIVIYNYR